MKEEKFMTNLGFRILPLIQRPEKSILESFRGAATPLISDNMNRLHGTSYELRAFHKSAKMLGTAFTVRTRSGDNLMVHKAIDLAEPGDVIVVDAGGEMSQAIIGEIMMSLALKKGLAGFVIDGAIRDSTAFQVKDFPCYARGITHRGPHKEGPGEINVPITVGNMIIHPGDIMVGDEDGVVAIPLDAAEEILEKIIAQQKREQSIMEAIEDGTIDRGWVDESLRQKGCVLS
jgi:RraA family protein